MTENEVKIQEALRQFEGDKATIKERAREQMVQERNREIQAIIEKLGDETHDTQKLLVQQYEAKVAELDKRAAKDLAEERVKTQQAAHRLHLERDERIVVDENLRVLTRRVQDLEQELTDGREARQRLEHAAREQSDALSKVEERQTFARREAEAELLARIEEKEREIRALTTKVQEAQHEHALEAEQVKTANKNDLELIQEKIQAALAKKKEIIDSLHEEVKLKDLQILKLKELLEQ